VRFQGIADPEKVAIYGGSYGGYATLAGLCFTPDLYCCGVDIVGPSHAKTLFQSIPPYWAPLKKQLIDRVGDVENDDEMNRKISPYFHADKIT
jgi:dipeptidyl aminopeptidase/acylaminoacyl peptidase